MLIMSVRLFISLVFITKIFADDISSEIFSPSPDHLVYNVHAPRKLINELIEEPAGGAAVPNIQTDIKEKPEDDINNTNEEKEDLDSQENEDIDAENSEAIISYPPYGSYQVTEAVLDIPDDRTKAGPIHIFYTKRPQLNIANATDKVAVTEANSNIPKNKKNRVSIHIDAEFEKEEIKENKVVGFLKGVKECFQNLQKGFIDGVYKFFHNKNEDVTVDKEKNNYAVNEY